MTKGTKHLIGLAIAVLIGIWIYRKIQAKQAASPAMGTTYTDASGAPVFAGPNIDPKTGAYLNPGSSAGTVEFSAQGN